MTMLNIKPEMYERLARKAAAQNTTVEQLVEPALERLVEADSEGLPYEQWAVAFKEWMEDVQRRADRYPPGFVADDSRESIYEGRGE